MSTALEAASLVMVPSGYEDGTLASVKPTDGTGDFTFSRGSNLAATRVNADGYIEKGYENRLYPSSDFSVWATSGLDTPEGGYEGYDGSNNAFKITANATNGYLRDFTTISGVQTHSFYFKEGNVNWVQIRVYTSITESAWFDLSGGGDLGSASGISSSIEPAGNGFFRCSFTTSGSVTQIRIFIGDNGSTSISAGDYLYIQDAMLNQGLAAYPYIETTTALVAGGILEDMPRLDYSNGSCPALLLEPQRTQLITQSEYFDSWVKIGSPTLTTNYGISPDGQRNSTRFESVSDRIYTNVGPIAANETFSVYMKGSGRAYFILGNTNNFNQVLTSEWQRYEFKTTQAGTNDVVQIRASGTALDMEIWGAQYEAGSYPTSYIPTYGVSQTRLADVCSGAGEAETFNDNEGVLYAEISALANDGTFRNISVSNGTFGQAIRIYYRNNDDQITIFLNSDSDGSATISIPSATDYIKLAVKYDTDTIKIFINGFLEDTLSSLIMPTGLQQLDFSRAGSLPFYGNTKQLAYFPTALTDSECIELTTI